MSDYHSLTASEAAAAIRAGVLSSSALLEDLLARIELVDPLIKSWVTIDREGARRTAKELDKEGETGNYRGLLHGIPVGIKDIFHVAGMTTTAGASSFAHEFAEVDAACVRRLREAGAILLGKTSTTEFAYLDPAETRNPWKLSHTPGGSSSGSGAAVAARMVPVALGSQTGGSTLRPAAFCGIIGFKPTYGRISCRGAIALSWSSDHVGIMCRSVEDAALLLQVLAGHEPADALSSRQPAQDYLNIVDQPPPLRLGFVKGPFREQDDGEILDHVELIVDKLRQAGAIIEEMTLPPDFDECYEAHRQIEQVEAAAFHEARYTMNKNRYRPLIRQLIESGLKRSGIEYMHAVRRRIQAKHDISEMLNGVAAIITPVSVPAPKIGDAEEHPNFWLPWSFVGLPALSLPTGLCGDGFPLAIQLVSAPFTEATLLAVARWCESVLGFFDWPFQPRQ